MWLVLKLTAWNRGINRVDGPRRVLLNSSLGSAGSVSYSQNMSKPKVFYLPLVFLAALLSVVTLAGFAFAADGAKKIRLAYAGWELGTAVAYVGVDAGLFKKYEIEVEEIPIRDNMSAGIQALLGVDLLIGSGSPLAILQPMVNGADITVIGSHVRLDQYGMGVASSIGAIKELKGKKVAVSALGARSDLIARVILRRAGLDPVRDVEIVSAGLAPARALAISKNLVQGAPLNEQIAAEAKKLGIKTLELKAVPVVTDLLVTTRSFIKKDEETIRRFMKGYAAAINHLVTRREESLAIIKKYFPDTQAGSVQAMYDSFSAQLRPLPELNSESLQALVDVGAVVDKRTGSIKPSDVIEPRFLEELKNSKFLKDLYVEKVSL
jgi:NitT/TauT family transport system substrate-binding protein